MPSRAPRRAVRLGLVATLLLVPALGACGATPPGASEAAGIEGTGDVVSELREVAPFSRISIAAGLKVIIGEGAEQSVELDAQQNLLPSIRTEVRDGQLIVTVPSPGVTATRPMSLALKLPRVESVALSSGATGYLEHTGGPLVLDVSGGATLTVIGDTTDLQLTATSASHAKLGELVAERAQVRVNDGSSVEIHAVASISGTADGGSTVILKAKPATVDVETKSGATVQGS